MAVDRLIRGGVQENNGGQNRVSKLIKAGSDVETELDTVRQVAEDRIYPSKTILHSHSTLFLVFLAIYFHILLALLLWIDR